MTLAYVALGGNLDGPRARITAAMDALDVLPDTRVRARSALYRTPPWGGIDQPDFINAVVCLETALLPQALLGALLDLEGAAGRVRGERNGPRVLDLDLLHMEGVRLCDSALTLPHPRLAERAFVLLPWNDIAPALLLPGLGRVADLLAAVDVAGCERLP